MEKQLTERQQEVFQYLLDYYNTNGYPPTQTVMAEHFGWASQNAAGDHLRAIAKKGWLINRGQRGYYPKI